MNMQYELRSFSFAPTPHRREYERYHINENAVLVHENNPVQDVLLNNASARGVGLACGFPLPVDSVVTIEFCGSKIFKDQIYKEAKVVWCKMITENMWRTGLDFGVLNPLEIFQERRLW